MVTKLEDTEECLKKELLPFIRAMFKKFYDSRAVFSNTASCIGELDCLCALAVVSSLPKMCRPKVLPPNASKQPTLVIKKLRHPCLTQFFSKGDFVANDITI